MKCEHGFEKCSLCHAKDGSIFQHIGGFFEHKPSAEDQARSEAKNRIANNYPVSDHLVEKLVAIQIDSQSCSFILKASGPHEILLRTILQLEARIEELEGKK